MADTSQGLLTSHEQVPNWLSAGRTTLILKEGEWSRANYRPITCMNTVYKAITTHQPRESTPGRVPTYSARSERNMRGDQWHARQPAD